MKLIAHRGNTAGPKPEMENSPEYIKNAIDSGYEVEIDLWSTDTKLFLGHDKPEYEIPKSFLEKNKDVLWIHCKNLEALYVCEFLLDDVHYFWHQEDDFTLTSKNIFWTFPGKNLTPNSVLVMPELYKFADIGPDIYGICTDEIESVKEMIDAL
jgi:glycerophosphoryl diester phosphodiesterase